MKRVLLALLLAVAVLPALAQLNPQEVRYTLGDKAYKAGQWDDVVSFWKPLLDWPPPWPIAARSRDEVVFAVAMALRKLQRFDDCAALLNQLQAKRAKDRDFALQISAFQLSGRLVANTDVDATLDGILRDPVLTAAELTTLLTATATNLGSSAPVEQALAAFLDARPTYPNRAAWQLTLVRGLARIGDHQAALARGTALLPQFSKQPDEPALVQLLADEEAQLGHPELAEARLIAWTRAHPSKEIDALATAYHRQAARMGDMDKLLQRGLPAVCDDPLFTALEREKALRLLPPAVPGALYRLDACLQAYLAKRPNHPARAEVVLTMAKMLSEAGDHRLALQRVRELDDGVVGTDREAATATFIAQEMGKSGDHGGAFHHLSLLLPFFTKDAGLLAELVDEGLQTPARTQPEFATLLTRAVKANPAESMIFAISVICERAITAGDLAGAKRWSALLDQVAYDHPRAARARKLLKSTGKTSPK